MSLKFFLLFLPSLMHSATGNTFKPGSIFESDLTQSNNFYRFSLKNLGSPDIKRVVPSFATEKIVTQTAEIFFNTNDQIKFFWDQYCDATKKIPQILSDEFKKTNMLIINQNYQSFDNEHNRTLLKIFQDCTNELHPILKMPEFIDQLFELRKAIRLANNDQTLAGNIFIIGKRPSNEKKNAYKFPSEQEIETDNKQQRDNPFHKDLANLQAKILEKVVNKQAIVYFGSVLAIKNFWNGYKKKLDKKLPDKLFIMVRMMLTKLFQNNIELFDERTQSLLKILQDISNNQIDNENEIIEELNKIKDSLQSNVMATSGSNKFKYGKRPTNERHTSHYFYFTKDDNQNSESYLSKLESEALAIEAIMKKNATVYFRSYEAITAFWIKFKGENKLISDNLFELVIQINKCLEEKNRNITEFIKILEDISNYLTVNNEKDFLRILEKFILSLEKKGETSPTKKKLDQPTQLIDATTNSTFSNKPTPPKPGKRILRPTALVKMCLFTIFLILTIRLFYYGDKLSP